ncbi:MAG: PAS domain-containing sensor histidine kinase [Elusimicrobia bacterium]|nr:PAS domain-containing sensor histidine kinase [Elusimicrobiota bacterium]
MKPLPTKFLPAELASPDEIRRQHLLLASAPLARKLLDAMPDPVFVLNEARQIVCMNRAAQDKTARHVEDLLGRRVGEVLGCRHAFEEGDACGTLESCTVCGAAGATAGALKGRRAARECRIQTREPGADLDLLVWATPFEHAGAKFIVFAASDIGHEKRRRVLERVFFHDALNLAGAVRGLAELMPGAGPAQLEVFFEDLVRSSRQLIEEISSQRDLAAAESGELAVAPKPCAARGLLESLAGLYRAHDAAKGRTIVVEPGAPEESLVTEPVLLARVLGNMLKNALEAEPKGAEIRLGARRESDGRFAFWVRNPTVMRSEVLAQVFQRSFSTKEAGRGLGTYSIRLLVERYLGGSVAVSSEPGRGTEFRIVLPAVLARRSPG